MMTTFCMVIPPPEVTFKVDHPFMVALSHRKGGATANALFLGRVMKPEE